MIYRAERAGYLNVTLSKNGSVRLAHARSFRFDYRFG